MKSLRLMSLGDPAKGTYGELALLDVPKPEPGDEEVLVKVAYSSICGSDPHIIKGEVGELRPIIEKRLPLPMGHELSGVVEKAGKKAEKYGIKAGDRVTLNFSQFCNTCYFCRTGRENLCKSKNNHLDAMSEYVCWHMSQVHKIPDQVSLLDASQTEPLSIALNCVRSANVTVGSRVAVFGAGAIGLMAVQGARLAGASLVVAFDIVPEKLSIAIKTGADYALNTKEEHWEKKAMELTEGLGFDSVVEVSGSPLAAGSVLDLMTPDGYACFGAMYPPEFNLPVNLFAHMYYRQKHITGINCSADFFPQTLSMVKRIDFKPLIQKIYKLDDYEQAYKDQFSGKFAKIVFEIGGE